MSQSHKPIALVIGAANGDGFITQAEMDAHHAQMKDAKHDAASKGGEGKCGEGKCGEGKCGGNP